MADIMKIVTIADADFSILKKKCARVSVTKENREYLKKLVKDMRLTMRSADGVGLSANQVGLDMSLFVAEVPPEKGNGRSKFYCILNPQIIKASKDGELLEEGCLSVPGVFGEVPRSSQIVVTGEDINGKPVKIKAWGFLARVFQHEIDHLNGFLILDRTKKLYDVTGTKEKKRK